MLTHPSFPRVEGYRVELAQERLKADFDTHHDDLVLELTPDLVGPTVTRNAGIIGEAVDLTVEHLDKIRPSTIYYKLTHHLLETKWRKPGEAPNLGLFGQLKSIVREWMTKCLVCKGGTYPGLLIYRDLADRAAEKITSAISTAFQGEKPIMAMLDPYNPTGSSTHVHFITTKTNLWKTDARRCQINYVVCDSDWEAEFCRVAEAHPKVKAYVKNQGLGFEVPYQCGSQTRRYLPDFIVLVDDGHGADDLLHLVVEIKGYRREDAREKSRTMNSQWVPGVNQLRTYGRWAFAEFGELYKMEADFAKKTADEFNCMIDKVISGILYVSDQIETE